MYQYNEALTTPEPISTPCEYAAPATNLVHMQLINHSNPPYPNSTHLVIILVQISFAQHPNSYGRYLNKLVILSHQNWSLTDLTARLEQIH